MKKTVSIGFQVCRQEDTHCVDTKIRVRREARTRRRNRTKSSLHGATFATEDEHSFTQSEPSLWKVNKTWIGPIIPTKPPRSSKHTDGNMEALVIVDLDNKIQCTCCKEWHIPDAMHCNCVRILRNAPNDGQQDQINSEFVYSNRLDVRKVAGPKLEVPKSPHKNVHSKGHA